MWENAGFDVASSGMRDLSLSLSLCALRTTTKVTRSEQESERGSTHSGESLR